MDHRITCPGCTKPLNAPASAVGKPGHCPHCRAPFHVAADGTVTPIVRRHVPGPLLVPAFGLLMLGAIATFVNGYLTVRLLTEPGFGVEYAKTQLGQIELIEALDKAKHREATRDTESALAGAAVVAGREAVAEGHADELARSWAAGMPPVFVASTAVSALVLLGGVAAVRGRFYPVAIVGCVAAAVNVNHLCCLPGAAVGLWGLLALVRDDVRPYFKRAG